VEDDQVLLVGYQQDGDTLITVVRSLAPATENEQ